MEKSPTALLLKFPGTNCDQETARALESVGFTTEVLPTSQLSKDALKGVNLLVLSGGFSYGDYVMSGRFAKLKILQKLGDHLEDFLSLGGYALGICNGFQILTQLGLLPEGSLVENTSGKFQCHWAGLKQSTEKSPYLTQLPSEFELPVAHAEGRFVTTDEKAKGYLADGLVTLQYTEDINGSELNIAGLQDPSGRVFGLMPHPERFLTVSQHYDRDWSQKNDDLKYGWGHYFFKSIFEEIKNYNPQENSLIA